MTRTKRANGYRDLVFLPIQHALRLLALLLLPIEWFRRQVRRHFASGLPKKRSGHVALFLFLSKTDAGLETALSLDHKPPPSPKPFRCSLK